MYRSARIVLTALVIGSFLLAGYALSSGPAALLWQQGEISGNAFLTIYGPLIKAASMTGTTDLWLYNYWHWWGVPPD
jgi:hypothetical protein